MSTYRVYVLNTSKPEAPTIAVAYVSADKYGPAWAASRSLLNDGKPHKDAPQAKTLFSDAAMTTDAKIGHGDHLTVAKIVDIKPRNVKMDKAALTAALDEKGLTPEQQLAKLRALIGAGAK